MLGNNEKFKELLAYVVKNFNDGALSETKLWKLLYFCEADFFEKYNKNITKVDFIKNHYGPTPDFAVAKKIVTNLENSGHIERGEANGGYLYKTLEEYPIKKLSGEEVKSISDTCEKYYRLNRKQIVELAHNDPPYLGAEKNQKVDFSFVAYRGDDEIYDEGSKEKYEGEIDIKSARKFLGYVKQRS